MTRMKIVSWNINSLRKRQDRLFAWLEATKPDIVCLQETKCTDDQFPALALQAVGYHSAYHGEKSYNGVAILAQTEPRDVRPSLCDEVVDPQARVIAATIGDVRVFSIYAPNGQAIGSPAYQYKLHWYRRLRDCIAKEKSADRTRVRRFQRRPGGCRCLRSGPLARRHHVFGGRTRCLSRLMRSRLARHTADPSQGRRTFQLVGLSDAARFQKIAACASTQFWRAKSWQQNALRPGLIAKCAKATNLPITRQFGQSL